MNGTNWPNRRVCISLCIPPHKSILLPQQYVICRQDSTMAYLLLQPSQPRRLSSYPLSLYLTRDLSSSVYTRQLLLLLSYCFIHIHNAYQSQKFRGLFYRTNFLNVIFYSFVEHIYITSYWNITQVCIVLCRCDIIIITKR